VLRRKLNDVLTKPFTRHTADEVKEPIDGDNNTNDAPACSKKSPVQEQDKLKKKRGAPKGHRGATRKKPEREPDRIVFTTPGDCPRCGSDRVRPCKDVEEHFVEDVEVPEWGNRSWTSTWCCD